MWVFCGSAVFLLWLVDLAQVQAQCTAPTVGENMVLTDASLNQTYDDGARVTFSCSNGSKPVNPTASDWVSCSDGTWTELQLQCKLTCPYPFVGDNRVLTPSSFRDIYFDGSSATFKCADGYRNVEPVINKVIKCIGGNWTELEFKCKKKSCRNPGEITNGWYDMPAGVEFGSIITGKCNKGYRPAGQVNTRKCMGSDWDGRTTMCEAVKCLKPPSIVNGDYSPKANIYVYGESVTYYCNSRSLSLIGNRTITCSDEGTFQSPPNCRDISCPAVKIVNGYRSHGSYLQSYIYRNFLEFQCEKGFKINGSSRIVCEMNGWDPPPPNCEEVTCKAQDVEHGFIVGGKAPVYKEDALIEYRCDKSYQLVGSKKLSCTENGWNLKLPVCREVICEAPYVAHASIVGGEAEVYRGEDSIEFSCDEGYKMEEGSNKLMCTETGWNQPIPKCIEVTCVALDVAHAKIVEGKASLYKKSNLIEYRCDEGYEMFGHNLLTCTDYGWNPNPPVCKRTCEAEDVDHAVIMGEKASVYREHEFIEYRCNTGYKLDGSSKLICTESGWNLRPPVCREVICEAQDVAHAVILAKKVYREHEVIEYQCDKGYKMEGSGKLTCTESGWSRSSPVCNEVTCVALDVAQAKIVEGKALVYKKSDFIEYRCDEGYEMVGHHLLTCTETGWNPNPPVCQRTCEAEDVAHAVIMGEKALVYRGGDFIKYRCNEGYVMKGSGERICTVRGWSSIPPVCNEFRVHLAAIISGIIFVTLCLGVCLYCLYFYKQSQRKSEQLQKKMSGECETIM